MLRANFDKLLLCAIFLTLLGTVVHMSHDHADAGNVAWGREQVGTILGALLGLITGAALGKNAQTPKDPE